MYVGGDFDQACRVYILENIGPINAHNIRYHRLLECCLSIKYISLACTKKSTYHQKLTGIMLNYMNVSQGNTKNMDKRVN